MLYRTCHRTTTMERDKTLKHNIEPDEDQPMARPHHQHHHEASSSRRLPHEGEREEPGKHASSPYLSPQQQRSCSTEHVSPRAEHTSSANAITWHFNDDFNIVVHSIGCQPCKEYSLHFCSSMIEQDVLLCHVQEALRAHFMVDSREPTGSTTRDSRRAQA
jgi:hypothetical protein